MRAFVPALALVSSLFAASAHADSFKTTPHAGSKVAAKVGPAPYTGRDLTRAQADKIVKKGATLMRRTQNAAIRMDAIRVVDSATMSSRGARRAFARSLKDLSSQSGDARDRFARGFNLLMRDGGRGALKMVGASARQLKSDSAVQLGAFQAYADFAMGQIPKGEKRQLLRQAAGFLEQAQKLQAARPRALVAENLKQTEAYLAYYPELKSYLK